MQGARARTICEALGWGCRAGRPSSPSRDRQRRPPPAPEGLARRGPPGGGDPDAKHGQAPSRPPRATIRRCPGSKDREIQATRERYIGRIRVQRRAMGIWWPINSGEQSETCGERADYDNAYWPAAASIGGSVYPRPTAGMRTSFPEQAKQVALDRRLCSNRAVVASGRRSSRLLDVATEIELNSIKRSRARALAARGAA